MIRDSEMMKNSGMKREQEQIERIKKMERLLDEGTAAIAEVQNALERYKAVLPGLEELEAYYQSKQWMRDLEDDENGRLPEDLKRGVLSEDAVWDLLTEHSRLLEMFSDKGKDK